MYPNIYLIFCRIRLIKQIITTLDILGNVLFLISILDETFHIFRQLVSGHVFVCYGYRGCQ